jgi:hypothetical protein
MNVNRAGEWLTFGVAREKKKPLREFSRRGSGPVGVGVIFERGSVVWLGLFLRLTIATLGTITALGTTAGTTLASGATLSAATKASAETAEAAGATHLCQFEGLALEFFVLRLLFG